MQFSHKYSSAKKDHSLFHQDFDSRFTEKTFLNFFFKNMLNAIALPIVAIFLSKIFKD